MKTEEIQKLAQKDWGWGGNLNTTISFAQYDALKIGPNSFVELDLEAKSRITLLLFFY